MKRTTQCCRSFNSPKTQILVFYFYFILMNRFSITTVCVCSLSVEAAGRSCSSLAAVQSLSHGWLFVCHVWTLTCELIPSDWLIWMYHWSGCSFLKWSRGSLTDRDALIDTNDSPNEKRSFILTNDVSVTPQLYCRLDGTIMMAIWETWWLLNVGRVMNSLIRRFHFFPAFILRCKCIDTDIKLSLHYLTLKMYIYICFVKINKLEQ